MKTGCSEHAAPDAATLSGVIRKVTLRIKARSMKVWQRVPLFIAFLTKILIESVIKDTVSAVALPEGKEEEKKSFKRMRILLQIPNIEDKEHFTAYQARLVI